MRRTPASYCPMALKPLAQTIALLLLAGNAQAAPAFGSSGWFAAKGAAQASGVARPATQVAITPPPLAQQQRVQQQLGRSIATMNNTVAAIAAAQAAQAAGRAAAGNAVPTINNGLGGNGLNFSVGADGKPLFSNAEGPQQTVGADGKVRVSIEQTADKAILNWDSFNIGRDTTLAFEQEASWAVLNRVNNSTAPSQIQGQIKADGTVMIVNGNGVVFSGSSQVNVRNLAVAAADISDAQFRDNGLYGVSSSAATFNNAAGKVSVEQGALIETAKPASATAGGGYVLLLGQEVDNAGTITTTQGQTQLAAGSSFVIRKGYSTDGNPSSTTRGNEVSVTGSGTVRNSGVLLADSGDISLIGNQVQQQGVALATTSTATRGTVHLTASGSGAKVTLSEGSTTAILLNASATALDSQRDALLAPAVDNLANQNVVAADTYRRDLSLVRIDSSGDVDFQNGSITLATGGQVAVRATGRSLVRDGAVIDVSGATGVQVAMESNSIKVNLQGNEQRDSAGNREDGGLNNSDVWVDLRDLVRVADGTNGYDGDRWYTAGGLLEVGGYLGTQNHSVSEWMAQGGTVSFTGGEVVTQAGSQLNLSGGILEVQSGYVQQTWLKGADGKLYELSSAPGDILYTGIYQGYEDHSERWGQTRLFYNPLLAPRQRYESGYSVGRDAGTLVVGTSSAVLEGQIVGDTYQGDRQTKAAQLGLDGYKQLQAAVARGAQLVVGSWTPSYVKDSASLEFSLGAIVQNLVLGMAGEPLAGSLELGSSLPTELQGNIHLASEQLAGLGGVKVAARQSISVDSALAIAAAGEIVLYAPEVAINADLTAHGGSIQAGNVLNQMSANLRIEDTTLAVPAGRSGVVRVADGVTLDASGLWSNLLQAPANNSVLPWRNGGTISLRSSGDVLLGRGSVLDVSAGAALSASGSLQGGNGGNITLAANANSAAATGELQLGGELRGYGVSGAGTLSLLAGRVLIDDEAQSTDAGTLLLRGDFFDKGFASYQVTGNQGLEVADGTQVDVTRPVYRRSADSTSAATGTLAAAALELWTPPLYQENPARGLLTQRQGASLSLQAGSSASQQAAIATTALTIGKGAVLNVDPGQSIALQGIGQITVGGTLNAWGGTIALRQGSAVGGSGAQDPKYTNADGRSIWIGETAILDVAARAATAVDAQGRRYGSVRDGGSIAIGGQIDHDNKNADLPLPFVVVREGASLDASGSSAVLDIAGQGATTVVSNGGRISLASASGLYLDGDMRAQSGGAGAAGGSLEVAMGMRGYGPQASDRLRQVHELVVGQEIGTSQIALGTDASQASEGLGYGHARIGANQVQAGGFDTLSLYSGGMIAFDGDVSLAMGQGLNLYAGSLGLTEASAADTQVKLAAPYVRLAGSTLVSLPDNSAGFGLTGMHFGASVRPMSQQAAAGTFTLEANSLLQIEGNAGLGTGGDLTLSRANGSEQVDRRAFDSMNLVSQGDIRFGSGTFYATGDLTLAAAQLYPMTGAVATVHTGWQGGNSPYASDRRLVIARTTASMPAQPSSVFGRLTLGAPTIEQGGILRAPLGALNVGQSDSTQYTQTLNLLSGSLTSISANGLLLPYGGTADGVTWQYDGESVSLFGAGGLTGTVRNVEVGLAAGNVDIQQGATLDLSGGGTLLGAAFVSGRGGSTDARYNPLMQYSADGFLLPALSTNPVYALIPGVQSGYAPMAGGSGAQDPMLGQQVTIGAGVPGLAAGIYTLLPSTYALLPGAFRVEVNGLAGQGAATAATAMRNGSWSVSGMLSVAGTSIRDSLASQLIVTPADVLRTYSQYKETSYADFVRADAIRLGVPRGMLEADARTLSVRLRPRTDGEVGFRYDGSIDFTPGAGGYGGTFSLQSATGSIEVLADGAQATAGYVSAYASDLNALGAARLSIGALPYVVYGQGGNFVELGANSSTSNGVVVRSGATLAAPEVLLIATGGGVEVQQGAVISTLNQGAPAYSSDDGYVYRPGTKSVLAVSNGRLQMLAAATENSNRPGPILVGTCSSGDCAGTTGLYSEGSIVFATDNDFELDDAVAYGTRHLALAVGGINVGSAEALAAAAERGSLASGLTLNQQVLERLLRGDTSTGAPALKTLELTAAGSMNFYESVTLSTLDAQGVSLLDNLMLTTPGLYGYGTAGDQALIRTSNLIWNGAVDAPSAVIANGAGTGSGRLTIEAQNIVFGFGDYTQPDPIQSYDRLALGFANVSLQASASISANHRGSLAVYQQQGAYVPGKGFTYSGGNVNIVTPLLTGGAGSVNHLRAGGDIQVSAPAGANVAEVGSEALGSEMSISGRTLQLDTRVVLPSGKLSLIAEENLLLGGGADIDLSGRTVSLNDVDQYSWGGDLILESRGGNIVQAASSRIDISAKHNQGGTLKATALAANAGSVQLLGSILAASSGYYDAGGTAVPYKSGSVDILARNLGSGALSDDFAALNARLNEGAVFGARSFQLKQGDLTIGNAADGSALLKAGEINLSVDGGQLIVNGVIDASGERVGSIRLAGKQGLTLGSGAVLDAHGTILRVDSYGQIIDAPNRAIVELGSGDGQLTLVDGVRIDLRHGTASTANDGKARGTLELNAPRLGSNGSLLDADAATYGDIAIDARGNLDIQGASSIALNAVQRYDDTDPDAQLHDGSDAASNQPYRVIDQAYLNAKHLQSVSFINAAVVNNTLLNGKLAGLTDAYENEFHLRPGVEIASAGDLVVQGDLDLSGMRYASLNPNTQKTSVYGSGEVGSLVVRAGGNLDIYGSISDGFAPPPETPDDDGWVLVPGIQPYDGELIMPRAGIVLADGTTFQGGTTLNYDLPVKALTLPTGTRVPVQVTLTGALVIPVGTVLTGDVRNADGSLLLAAGTLLDTPLNLTRGMRLDAGSLLPAAAGVEALTWPGGVALPGAMVMAGDLTLRLGAVIPTGTNLKLPGDALSVPLRLADGSQQGRNWAVAQMLPEGSQSWSMRLVAGADTAAADSRMLRADGEGSLLLADTHYGLYNIHEKIVIPGTPAKPGGAWYWAPEYEEVAYELGSQPGPMPEEWIGECPSELCVLVQYVWNEVGVELMPLLEGPEVKLGEPADALIASNPSFYSYCVFEGLCNSLGEAVPATPEQTIVGDVIKIQPLTKNFSVLRTGTGDLDLLAAGDLEMRSLYGIYTAGTSTASRAGTQAAAFDRARSLTGNPVLGALAAADQVFEGYERLVDESAGSLYSAWYPDQGGNLTLRVGGGLFGDLTSPYQIPSMMTDASEARPQLSNANVGNWLWRQGSGDTAGIEPISTSWWINFGTYVASTSSGNSALPDASIFSQQPVLVGFTGIGTLGGGNLSLDVGKDAGITRTLGLNRSQGLALAVGSTGRVTADGQLMLTGGGDLDLRIGGSLNPAWKSRALSTFGDVTSPTTYITQDLALVGALSNLRGALQLDAGALGGIALTYGSIRIAHDSKESRPYDAFTSTLGNATGGISLVLGDATASLQTRGDLVLTGSGDPGRITTQAPTAYRTASAAYDSGGYGWFSLWTDSTAISLFSAGGNLAPSTQLAGYRGETLTVGNSSGSDGRFIYPSQLRGVAANGSLYLGPSSIGESGGGLFLNYPLVVAPGERASLQLLAADSIYAGGYSINVSGASLDALPTPFRTAFAVPASAFSPAGPNNLHQDASPPLLSGTQPLFAFDTASTVGAQEGQDAPTRFYAVNGDIVGLRTGEILSFTTESRTGQIWYEASGPVWMMAGRDIVNSGTPVGTSTSLNNDMKGGSSGSGASTGNLFVHHGANDVSVVSAGRDIRHSNFNIAGPGTLEISAGRDILMEDRGAVTSLGAVVPADARPGADIVMQAGMGEGADFLAFAQRYIDPANLAQGGVPLAEQAGKVVHTYEAELIEWLGERYGFSGDTEQALAHYAALPAEQQRIFARTLYFAELRAGGREYNDASSPRFGSYLRGRSAIDLLFPSHDVAGNVIPRQGDITLYGGSGVRTNFGGNIQMLTPGGQQLFGLEGVVPPGTAGIVTQGSGDIQLFSQGSILLGLSRIMTTFGGDILGWSAEGDINAGRGSKTTIVYTPARRIYDNWGNVALSPTVPSSGAGIATLNPIPEVPAGDVDLLAPLGTIDAGEAGIRVSGNVNLAALQVVNAANIQVQGDSAGVPLVASVNVGALTSASSAASSATDAAENAVREQQRSSRQRQPSIVTVRVLGFGEERLVPSSEGASRSNGYDRSSGVQVIGAGQLSDEARSQLTGEERGNLSL